MFLSNKPDALTDVVYGVKVYVSEDLPKKTLSEEVIPGVVPWPPGFKEEIDAWMISFFGTYNNVKDGEIIKTVYGLHMNPRTREKVREAIR